MLLIHFQSKSAQESHCLVLGDGSNFPLRASCCFTCVTATFSPFFYNLQNIFFDFAVPRLILFFFPWFCLLVGWLSYLYRFVIVVRRSLVLFLIDCILKYGPHDPTPSRRFLRYCLRSLTDFIPIKILGLSKKYDHMMAASHEHNSHYDVSFH